MSNNGKVGTVNYSKALRQAEKDLRQARELAKAKLPEIRFVVTFIDLDKRLPGGRPNPDRTKTIDTKPSDVLVWAKKQLETMGEQSRITAAPIYPPIGNFGLEEEKAVVEYINSL